MKAAPMMQCGTGSMSPCLAQVDEVDGVQEFTPRILYVAGISCWCQAWKNLIIC